MRNNLVHTLKDARWASVSIRFDDDVFVPLRGELTLFTEVGETIWEGPIGLAALEAGEEALEALDGPAEQESDLSEMARAVADGELGFYGLARELEGCPFAGSSVDDDGASRLTLVSQVCSVWF